MIAGANAAAVSNYPGKTRHLFFYTLQGSSPKIYLVDAPGYGNSFSMILGFAKGDKKELE